MKTAVRTSLQESGEGPRAAPSGDAMKTSVRRSPAERGSALLIVLVMAAVIAIMLYRELPVATFEAQRQKEQLLVTRGNEYARAVKLYVRKFQSYPPTLDALENTNRMRFLRFRYVDPFTGKADWRLLHAGPGGVIIDSKVKKTGGLTGLSGNSNSTSNSSTLGAPASVTNPFNNSFDTSNPNGQPANSFPQRPPAISAAQAASSGLPVDVTATQSGSMPPDPFNSGNPMTTSSYPAGVNPGRFRGGNPTGSSYPPGQMNGPYATDPNLQQSAVPTGIDTQSQMQNLANNSNPPPAVNNTSQTTSSAFSPASSTSSGTSSMGTMNGTTGSGIAGVASKAEGHTIKSINDQTERTLWEFVYDMQKEATANAPNLGGGSQNNSGSSNNNSGNNGLSNNSGAASPSGSTANQ